MFKYMVIGAHPDDCESVSGIALKLLDLGHRVKYLTATNGCSGHHEQMGGALAVRRQEEARRVSALTGVECEALDIDDGSLTAGLAERKLMMRAIREFNPDVIITHRPWDYHPDHRNASLLVQDCAYLTQVPNVCPLTPAMERMPAIFYMQDNFQKPCPFSPDLIFDIDSVADRKLMALHQHTSQMYEWLPHVDRLPDEIPESDAERVEWLRKNPYGYFVDAEKYRPQLIEKYGEAGRRVRYIEALEACEYGRRLSKEETNERFPF